MPNSRGFTLLELMVVTAIIAVLFALTVPNVIEPRKRANEAAALGRLRHYLGENIRGAVAPGKTENGYKFVVFNIDEYDWFVNANPTDPGKSGDNYFYVDRSGVLRFSTTGPADAASKPIGD